MTSTENACTMNIDVKPMPHLQQACTYRKHCDLHEGEVPTKMASDAAQGRVPPSHSSTERLYRVFGVRPARVQFVSVAPGTRSQTVVLRNGLPVTTYRVPDRPPEVSDRLKNVLPRKSMVGAGKAEDRACNHQGEEE